MALNYETYISSGTLYFRNLLTSNITDPLTGLRTGSEVFVMTAWPKRPVRYPYITVQFNGVSDVTAGMQSTERLINCRLEVDVWTKRSMDRDILAGSVHSVLRNSIYTSSTGTVAQNLHDFKLASMVPISEPAGEETIHREHMEFTYLATL